MLELGPELFTLLNAEQHVGRSRRVVYGQGGMKPYEIENVESQLGFRMPEDFKYLLQNVQDPDEVLFPWANFSKHEYDESITWILGGIEFDIAHNVFWLEHRWGPRPEDLAACLDIARRDFFTWPRLLPVYGHRFLAAEPCTAGNPVFSIKQTDIIYYGANLAHYLMLEFVPDERHADHTAPQSIRNIAVWSDLTD